MPEPLHRILRDVAWVVRCEQAIAETFIDTPKSHHAVNRLLSQTSVAPSGFHLRQGLLENVRWESASGRQLPGEVGPRQDAVMEEELGLNTMHPSRPRVPQVMHEALSGLGGVHNIPEAGARGLNIV
jgi:hypothetical protein